MFTSLKFSTQLSLPRGRILPSSNRVYQKHTIDIVGPQKLLRVQLSILLDAQINEITDLRILRSSSWAERDLGVFIRMRAEKKDLGNICWAIDSYWELARKRAEYWYACETSFAHLIAGKTGQDTENVRPIKPAQNMARKDFNRHLGRDTLILQDKHVLLKLRWSIGFDWTGEAESDITVEPAFPLVCKLIQGAWIVMHTNQQQGPRQIPLQASRRFQTPSLRFYVAKARLKQPES